MKLGLRVTPQLKERLDAAAEQSGRSQSQEAEFRLERSFDRGDLLSDVLSLAYGPQAAGILMLLGLAMGQAAYAILDRGDDDPRTADWFRCWPDDPEAREVGLVTGLLLLTALRPGGAVSKAMAEEFRKPPKRWSAPGWGRSLAVAAEARARIRTNTDKFPFFSPPAPRWFDATTIRSLMGPELVEQLNPGEEIGQRATVEGVKRAFRSMILDLRQVLDDDNDEPKP